MNLAEYEKLDTDSGNGGEWIKFQNTGDTKYLRFLYKSGGDKMGEDINFRRKFWDEAERKFVYDTPEGQLVCSLDCIEYDADGKNPRLVKWERSAYFCKTVLLPAWKNFPRIIDGVWKVTASSPKTLDASYALFPVMGATEANFPIIDKPADTVKVNAKPAPKPATTPAPTPTAPTTPTPATPVAPTTEAPAPAPKKKYWE